MRGYGMGNVCHAFCLRGDSGKMIQKILTDLPCGVQTLRRAMTAYDFRTGANCRAGGYRVVKRNIKTSKKFGDLLAAADNAIFTGKIRNLCGLAFYAKCKRSQVKIRNILADERVEVYLRKIHILSSISDVTMPHIPAIRRYA